MPPALPLIKLIGPSFILLGLGLGSGEVILWPYLSSNWGLGIVWGAFLGILFQFFINMEIERYALVFGESVFVGFGRKWKYVPYWLIISTLIGFVWPGIIASSAFLFAFVFGGNQTIIAITFLLMIGIVLSVGKYIYNTVERFSKIIIIIGIPFVFLLTLYFAKLSDWGALFLGAIGKGNDYWFFPQAIPLASFFAAIAFSGAGGNLNLAQSSYIREKGYGMGHFATKLKGLLEGGHQVVDLNGYEFEPSKENVSRFGAWWRAVNIEHFFVFFVMGLLAMFLLLLLSYVTTFGIAGNETGINFVINEARIIGQKTLPLIGSLFALLMASMLFLTQFTVLDANSRIMSENYAILKSHRNEKVHLSKIYYWFLWMQIIFGIIILASGFSEPLTLLVLSALINAVCMFVHIGLVYKLNQAELPAILRLSKIRKIVIGIAFVFFGIFSATSFYKMIINIFVK